MLKSSTIENNLPTVSVIIVNYNGQRYLEPCLSSLFKLNYPSTKYEVILADNASTDGSVDYVKSMFPAVKIIEMKVNSGFIGGINAGAKQAKGDYLIILNNDIYVDENWMLELVRSLDDRTVEIGSSKNFLMDNHSILDAAGCTNNIIGQGWDIGMFSQYDGRFEASYEITHPGGASCIMKRRALEKYGYVLDPNFFMSQDDLDLGWRARLLGYKVMYAPKAIAYHKRGGTSANSPLSFYYFYRNMHVAFYQNLETSNLNKVLPLIDANIAITHIFKFVETKNVGFLTNLPKIFTYLLKNKKEFQKKRAKIQKIRKCDDNKIFGLFSTLIIVPKGVERFQFMPKLFLTLLNLYLKITGIRVKKFNGIYYY